MNLKEANLKETNLKELNLKETNLKKIKFKRSIQFKRSIMDYRFLFAILIVIIIIIIIGWWYYNSSTKKSFNENYEKLKIISEDIRIGSANNSSEEDVAINNVGSNSNEDPNIKSRSRQKSRLSSIQKEHFKRGYYKKGLDYVNKRNFVDVTSSQYDQTTGGLYQACPCQDGLICSEGVCKQKPFGKCLTSSSCMDDQFCFIGTCIERPNSWEEKVQTKYKDNQITISSHAFRLSEEHFILPKGWWQIRDIISILDGYLFGTFYVVSKDTNIYCLFADSIIRGLSIIKYNSGINPKQLFRLNEELYLVSEQGRLFRLNGNEKSDQWDFTPLKYFYGKNVSSFDIINVITNPDQSVIFYQRDGQIRIYRPGKEWTFIPKTEQIRKISYNGILNQKDSDTSLIKGIYLRSDRLDYRLSDSDKIYSIEGNFIDAELDHRKNEIIVIDQHKAVVKIIISKNQKYRKIRVFDNHGSKLIKTNNDIWVISEVATLQI